MAKKPVVIPASPGCRLLTPVYVNVTCVEDIERLSIPTVMEQPIIGWMVSDYTLPVIAGRALNHGDMFGSAIEWPDGSVSRIATDIDVTIPKQEWLDEIVGERIGEVQKWFLKQQETKPE